MLINILYSNKYANYPKKNHNNVKYKKKVGENIG